MMQKGTRTANDTNGRSPARGESSGDLTVVASHRGVGVQRGSPMTVTHSISEVSRSD